MLKNMVKVNCFSAICALIFHAILLGTPLSAQDEPVLLTVEISNPGGSEPRTKAYTRPDLMELPQRSFTTSTNWTSGTPTFSGVALADLLMDLDVTSGEMELIAINDYSVFLNVDDPLNIGAILALLMDGETMTPRDKGPIWLVYDYDSDAAYRTETVYSRSIWQLDRIVISR